MSSLINLSRLGGHLMHMNESRFSQRQAQFKYTEVVHLPFSVHLINLIIIIISSGQFQSQRLPLIGCLLTGGVARGGVLIVIDILIC
ncbi:hypothetical protein DPMN_179617 [Dreissena polymorpha]|uniref:Uncharacterized protein n=1 Tax=Dreissena polymorpha TaxID=45954 RepID=A0A9D4ECN6_DREPO|nr:hypothetical protein DPMN_179617 [Dreissena polymorpha]